jgi:hypothetical protein
MEIKRKKEDKYNEKMVEPGVESKTIGSREKNMRQQNGLFVQDT